jgi:hypothetical protein
MNPILHYMLKPGAILLCLVALFFLIGTILRGRRIPQCFQCGAIKVRPSRPIGFLDLAGARLMIRSYRCSGCLVRFHAMRFTEPAEGWREN